MSGLDERRSADQDAAARDSNPSTDAGSAPGATQPGETASAGDWRKIKPYLALFDFARRPESKAAWIVRVVAIGVAVVALWQRVGVATRPLLSAKPPPAIPTEEVEGYKFRLPEHTRRAIFAELAAAELAERARAIKANSWNGHVWSREDDRGHYERVAVRAVAAKHKISLSQTYLVLDEGIRERWPGPDGKPLPATTPPLNIRSNSW
jgi:hypothetical protein